MEEKDKLIASLREQLQRANSNCSALEQENALLNYEMNKLKHSSRRTVKASVL